MIFPCDTDGESGTDIWQKLLNFLMAELNFFFITREHCNWPWLEPVFFLFGKRNWNWCDPVSIFCRNTKIGHDMAQLLCYAETEIDVNLLSYVETLKLAITWPTVFLYGNTGTNLDLIQFLFYVKILKLIVTVLRIIWYGARNVLVESSWHGNTYCLFSPCDWSTAQSLPGADQSSIENRQCKHVKPPSTSTFLTPDHMFWV